MNNLYKYNLFYYYLKKKFIILAKIHNLIYTLRKNK